MQVKVFSQGMPPDSLWVEPPNTWADIMSGKLTGTEGLFISVATALRLIDAMKDIAKSTDIGIPDWCGSEGGTPRKMVYDDEQASWPPGNYPYDPAPPIK